MTFTRTGDTLKRAEEERHLYLQALRLIGGRAMKPILAASLLVLALSACGGPSDEDVLTDEKIRASQSAPELPDIQLSDNPEPPPAPPPPSRSRWPTSSDNEVDRQCGRGRSSHGTDPAGVPGPAGASVPADCRPGEVARQCARDHRRHADVRRVGRPRSAAVARRRAPNASSAFFDYDGDEAGKSSSS